MDVHTHTFKLTCICKQTLIHIYNLHKLRVTHTRILHACTTHAYMLAFNANTPIYTHINTHSYTYTHTSHTHTNTHTYKHAWIARMHPHMHTCTIIHACIYTFISTDNCILTLNSCTQINQHSTHKNTLTHTQAQINIIMCLFKKHRRCIHKRKK